MRKRNKGFTLIELLAVIVVLAVIALIAVPIVLNLVNTAKKGAAQASAIAFVKEVDTYILLTQMNPELPKLENGETYQISRTKYEEVAFIDLFVGRVYAEENEEEIYLNEIIDMKGTKPTSGTVTIYGNKVSEAKIITNGYNVSCIGDTCEAKGKSNVKDEEESEKEPEVVYSNVLEKAKLLVYDENGICKNDGSTYEYMNGCYIKGASSSNYVWYNGFMWRIMGINSDDTVRLITDENVTALAYGPADSGLTYEDNEGYIHDWLNEYFYNHLNSTNSIIQNGAYFCSETTNATRLTEGREKCTSGSEVTTKVGLISYDEYLLANTSSSYINIGQQFWTMTPFNTSIAWRVDYNDSADYDLVEHLIGVRPVINVSFDAAITAGDGSARNFFVLSEDKTNSITGKLIDKATSGEYVSLEGHTYRVVSKDNDGVKLILDGFYEKQVSYGSNNIFTLDSGIGQELNVNGLKWLGISDSEKIVETIYYQGDGFFVGTAYTDTLKQSNGVEAKVGLIQIGDILASQSSTLLTKNYTTTSSYNNTGTYWTMSKCSSVACYAASYGNATDYYDLRREFSVRPVIKVSTSVNISGGNGTWKNPYRI